MSNNQAKFLWVGMRIVDNDARSAFQDSPRTLEIVRVLGRHVDAKNERTGLVVRIQMNRIFGDSKPRKSGFSVIGAP